jgi:hypothetical protein
MKEMRKPYLARAWAPALALLAAVSFIGQVHWLPAQFALVAEIKTDKPARLQLRYNRGYGNRQEGVSTRIVEKTGEFVRVRFPIQVNSAHDLRLVNLGFGHALDIRGLALQPLGGATRTITATDLSPNSPDKSETRLTQIGGTIHVESNGAEPLVLHIDQDSRIPASRLAQLLQWLFVVPLSFAAIGVILISRRHTRPRAGQPSEAEDAGCNSRRARNIVISTLAGAYFVFSFLGLNGSSAAVWSHYADREMPTAGVLFGSPKEIRSDEWLIQTPWIFSQALRTPALSVSNPSIGSDVTPLVTNLPVRHWSTWFRPQMWPFFILNPERAFAFYWNFKTFGLLLSAFLFFGVLSGGKTLLDLAGALFLTFSPFIQWWLSTPTCLPEMLAMVLTALWLVAVVGRTHLRWQAALAAVALVVATENFIFCCYPRFQIPLAYLAVALVLAMILAPKKADELRQFRVCCLGLTLLLIAFATWRWSRDVAEVVRITSLLSYPGQLRFTGGGFEWRRLFDPFLEFSMTGDRFPERLENASEAAGFLFLAPILAARVLWDAGRRRVDGMLVIPLVLIAFAIVYMAVGIPQWLATLSGWSYVSPVRAQLLVGVATSILLFRWLASGEEESLSATNRWLIFGVGLLLLLPVLRLTNVGLGHFEASSVVVATAICFGLVGLCIWQRSAVSACLLLVVPQFYACALVNPIAQGVPAITRSPTFQWLAKAHENKPGGNWIVLGGSLRAQLFPEFVKATGADVLGGMRCNPDYPTLRLLDPAGKFRALTDRYAWIHFKKEDGDMPVFEAAEGLAYDIRIPLRVGLLDQLNVKHILEVDLPMNEEAALPGFSVTARQDGCRLLQRD